MPDDKSSSPIYSLAVFVHDQQHPDAVIENIRILSQEEYDEFVQASATLNKWLKADMESFSIFEYSYNKFLSTVEKVRNELITPTLPKVDKYLVAINADFFSFLSLMRLYLDHTAKKIGSKNKDVLDAYNKATNIEFDNYFSYRFFYQLRNYAQHLAMPLKGMDGSSKLDVTQTKVINTFKLYFIRDELLVHKDNWTKKVLPDLIKQPAHIPVLPLIKEVMSSMQRIHIATMKAYKPLIKQEIALIHRFKKDTGARNERPFVFKIDAISSDRKGNVVGKDIPFDLIEYLEKRVTS